MKLSKLDKIFVFSLFVLYLFSFDLNSMENIWFDQRLKMLDNSLEFLKKEEKINENENDDSSCARCRIYQKRKKNNTQLFNKIKHIYQIHNEHNYSKTHLQYSTSGFSFEIYFLNLIFFVFKLRI
jgi:hypothetical protein